MAEKKEHKIISLVRRYWGALLAGCALLLLFVYFVNLMFVQNQKTAVSVLVLEFVEDTSGLERQIREAVGADEKEKVEIRTISYGVQANKAVALTWIRAEVVDVIIGAEELMTEFAQAGYLKDLDKMERSGHRAEALEEAETEGDGAGSRRSGDFLCGLAEFDQEGNVTGLGPDTCFGKYTAEIPGAAIETPVAGLADNAPNLENGQKLIDFFASKRNGVID